MINEKLMLTYTQIIKFTFNNISVLWKLSTPSVVDSPKENAKNNIFKQCCLHSLHYVLIELTV